MIIAVTLNVNANIACKLVIVLAELFEPWSFSSSSSPVEEETFAGATFLLDVGIPVSVSLVSEADWPAKRPPGIIKPV